MHAQRLSTPIIQAGIGLAGVATSGRDSQCILWTPKWWNTGIGRPCRFGGFGPVPR
jgi:hypothetical protein